MTREEALEKLRAVVDNAGGYISDRSIEMSLDGYVALGMIKLDDLEDDGEIELKRAKTRET